MIMSHGGDRRDVGEISGSIGHVAEQDESGAWPRYLGHLINGDPAPPVSLEPSQPHPELVRDPLDHKAVGRKVADVNDDLVSPALAGRCGPNPLVEHYAGRVPDHCLTGGRAQHHTANVVTDTYRVIHPALIPGTDQPSPPDLFDKAADPLARGSQRTTQGVAVEIRDHCRIVRTDELISEIGQWVRGVEQFSSCGEIVDTSAIRIQVFGPSESFRHAMAPSCSASASRCAWLIQTTTSSASCGSGSGACTAAPVPRRSPDEPVSDSSSESLTRPACPNAMISSGRGPTGIGPP